jgi:rusticyanin
MPRRQVASIAVVTVLLAGVAVMALTMFAHGASAVAGVAADPGGAGMMDRAGMEGGPMGSAGSGSPMGAMMGQGGAGPAAGSGPARGMMGAGGSGMAAMRANAGKRVGSMLAGRAPQVISPQRARTLGDQAPSGSTVDPQHNQVTFTTTSVHLTVVANPPYGHEMSFRIAGLTDPTVVVPKGAHITVQFINGDSDSAHGWMVTTANAPLPEMPMLVSGVAFPGAFAHPLGDPTTAGWGEETITFDASKSGQFTYLCPLPGHAQKGMNGAFIVQ